MARLAALTVAVAALSAAAAAVVTALAAPSSLDPAPSRQLSGRFLHLTDLHPDKHYKPGSAVSTGCHVSKPRKDKQRAGHWGTPVSGCDSPMRLVEESVEWVRRNWKGNDTSPPFDFIIWTGDSARHDIDSVYPRTREEIYGSNQWCLDVISRAFPGVPIVPNLGNNDVFPHNIMWPGPSELISAYADMWADQVPEYEVHTFQLGGYFTSEVVPGKLAVISLNTLYFYDSNKVVDGCKRIKRERRKRRKKGGRLEKSAAGKDLDAGTRQLLWLEAQLEQLRRRGLAVHIIGHVPPTAGNYFAKCYDAYSDIVLHFQDTVVGQHFGHMNVDAFFIQEDIEAEKRSGAKAEDDDDDKTRFVGGATALTDDLRKDYALLPSSRKTNESYYHYFFAAPGVVPTFVPSIRVWTYNVTGVDLQAGAGAAKAGSNGLEGGEDEDNDDDDDDGDDDDDDEDDEESDSTFSSPAQLVLSSPASQPATLHEQRLHALRRKHRRPKHGRRKRKRRHPGPRHSSRHSPSRMNKAMSLLGYSQWKLDLDLANEEWEQRGEGLKGAGLDYRMEYATYRPETLWGRLLTEVEKAEDDDERNVDAARRDDAYRPPSHTPVPRHLLEREIALRRPTNVSDVSLRKKKEDKRLRPLRHLTEYRLESITLSSMLALARRLVKDDDLWARYEERVYGESGYTG